MNDLLAELRNEADSIFRHPDIDGLISRAADEIERLRSVLKGVEIALARDGDIDGAMKLILDR